MDEFTSQIDAYDKGICDVMTVSDFIIRLANAQVENEFCTRNLVVTESVVVDYHIAFPTRPEIASGLSYWIGEGERDGVTLDFFAKRHNDRHQNKPICDCTFASFDETNEYARISVSNVFLPVIFFLSCAVIAMVLQLHLQRTKKNQKQHPLGRVSHFHHSKYTNKDYSNDVTEDEGEAKSAPKLDHAVPKIDNGDNGIIQKQSPNKSVRFATDDEQEDDWSWLHSSDGGSALNPDTRGSAPSRIQHLVETGALDELIDCLQEIKRPKQM